MPLTGFDGNSCRQVQWCGLMMKSMKQLPVVAMLRYL